MLLIFYPVNKSLYNAICILIIFYHKSFLRSSDKFLTKWEKQKVGLMELISGKKQIMILVTLLVITIVFVSLYIVENISGGDERSCRQAEFDANSDTFQITEDNFEELITSQLRDSLPPVWILLLYVQHIKSTNIRRKTYPKLIITTVIHHIVLIVKK